MTDSPSARPTRRTTDLVAAAAIGLVFAAFIPALQIYLIVDDFEWLDHVYPMAAYPQVLLAKIAGFFRPLVKVTYFLDYVCFGTWAPGYMATTLGVHLANVGLLFVLARRLLGRLEPAFAVAVLFGISPLHAEATLWAAARPDSMLLFFVLVTLLVFDRPRLGLRHHLLALGCCVAAAGCKESWVVLPGVVILFLWLVRGRRLSQALRLAAPCCALVVLYLGVFFVLPMVSGTRLPTAYGGESLFDGLVVIAGVMARYVGLGGLWQGAAWQAVLIWVGLAGLLGWCWHRRWSVAALGVLWMLAALLPTITVGFQPSRYSYVPLAGMWLAAGGLLERLWSAQAMPDAARKVGLTVATVVLLLAGVVSLRVLRVEIDDYLAFGESHRELVEMYRAVAPHIPKDRPLLLVNNGSRMALEEFVYHSEGGNKVGFPRPNGLWQLLQLPSVANFVGQPFEARMVPFPVDDPRQVLHGRSTVLVFTDEGFALAGPALARALQQHVEEHGRLPAQVEAYHHVRTRDGSALDQSCN